MVRSSVGAPTTLTASLKVTVAVTTLPGLRRPAVELVAPVNPTVDTVGTAVSTVTVCSALARPVLPARSVSSALKRYSVALASVGVVMSLYWLVMSVALSVTASPSAEVALRNCTRSPSSACVSARLTRTTRAVSSLRPPLATAPWTWPTSSVTLVTAGLPGAVVSTR